MAQPPQPKQMPWPKWASWTLIAAAVALLVTLAATLNDIY